MGGINRATLLGNLGADPEVRQTARDIPICRFRLATSERWKDRDGKWADRTEWHNVVVFGPQAGTCAKYLKKGRQVYVEGSFRTRSWKDSEGQTRYGTEVVAKHVEFLGPKANVGDELNTGPWGHVGRGRPVRGHRPRRGHSFLGAGPARKRIAPTGGSQSGEDRFGSEGRG